jgi:hypothetical protein
VLHSWMGWWCQVSCQCGRGVGQQQQHMLLCAVCTFHLRACVCPSAVWASRSKHVLGRNGPPAQFYYRLRQIGICSILQMPLFSIAVTLSHGYRYTVQLIIACLCFVAFPQSHMTDMNLADRLSVCCTAQSAPRKQHNWCGSSSVQLLS